jgi:hypothetical protein
MKHKKIPQKTFFIIAHTYQPPRNFLKLADTQESNTQVRASILSGVNERVYQECYKPIFVDSSKIPSGMMFSFYGTLREWLKEYHPREFQKIKRKIQNLPDKEYTVLCDPYLHPILPLMNEKDQDMLIKIGKKAFQQDFGFTPKGFWLPELAISTQTLQILYNNGFKFITLRSDQLKRTTSNPMYIPLKEKNKKTGQLAIFHFDKELSETVWFNNDATIKAENFLAMFPQKEHYIIGTDAEVYGHLLSYKDKFLSYVTKEKILARYNFTHFSSKKALRRRQKEYTQIKELSSWSCPHGIKRWTGECFCDTNDKKITNRIKSLYTLTQSYNNKINRELDRTFPAWQPVFISFFLRTRKAMFENGTLHNAVKKMSRQKNGKIITDPQIRTLFKAKIAALTAQTSCFAFFRDSDDRPEREITQINLQQIEKLLNVSASNAAVDSQKQIS